jgi:hypothetical protein
MLPLLASASSSSYIFQIDQPRHHHKDISNLPPQDAPTQPALASDLLAFPHKQQPLSRPPGVGISMSSAAVVLGVFQGL